MDKVCGNCGQRFPCGGGVEPCWCDQVRLDESQLTAIGSAFRDCLCPTCQARPLRRPPPVSLSPCPDLKCS